MDESQLEAIASQLSCPQGEAGIVTGNNMNLLNAFITARALEKLGASAAETIVEIGPGNGCLSEDLLSTLGVDGNYYAIELSEEMANEARQRLSNCDCRVEIMHCDCHHANIPEQSADGIIAVNLLYFIDDLHALFQLLKTWMKPGGRVVFGVRSDKSLNSLPFVHYKFNVRTPEEMMKIMRSNGFTDVDCSYYDEGEMMLGEISLTVDSVIIHGRLP
ncbi:MAG: class I SAM-dependent methyltransferase [Gammaproteobacteria bacterium]|nr:class I SAM-dependent methyltransferase [Gammaproteobacteria bacterium]